MHAEAILKKTSVSGVAAGWFKKVRMGTFFFIFAKKKKILQKWTIFSHRKRFLSGGKKKVASLLASKKDTRWTGNTSFF